MLKSVYGSEYIQQRKEALECLIRRDKNRKQRAESLRLFSRCHIKRQQQNRDCTDNTQSALSVRSVLTSH